MYARNTSVASLFCIICQVKLEESSSVLPLPIVSDL